MRSTAAPIAPQRHAHPHQARPARSRRGGRVAALLAALAVLASGCSFSDLAFTKDYRLHFSAPRSRALVKVPVTVRWNMSDFSVTPAGSGAPSSKAGYFAVFVDRAPIKPGETLRSIADRSCKLTKGCPDAAYLAQRGVYATTAPSVTLQQVPAVNSYQKVQTHEVTVVLLDTAGRRIGEAAWYVDFRMKKATY